MSEWKSRRTRRAKGDMNVVPYIDVMLVLLVIFMVAAPLIAPTVIDLPRVGARANMPTYLPIEVVMNKNGQIAKIFDRDPSARNEFSGELTIEAAVTRIKQQLAKKPEQPVVISADTNVPYGMVVKLMDDLKTSGVQRVGLSVQSQK
jgi:biopolymer transport protein TolR